MNSLFGFDWKKSPAHYELLRKFNHAYDSKEIYKNPDWLNIWKTILREHPQKAINRFVNEKCLVKPDLPDLLDFKFKLAELKNFSKKYGLPVSGKKAELIDGLFSYHKEEMARLVDDLGDILICSVTGHILLDPYIDHKKDERNLAEQIILEAIRNRKFQLAAATMIEFEKNQVFPRGIGIDWNKAKPSELASSIEELFAAKPKILADVSDEKMEILKLGGAFSYLWDKEKPELLLNSERISSRFDNVVAARMIWFYLNAKGNLKNYRSNSDVIEYVKVLACNDSCDECKKITKEKYRLDGEVIELPYYKCTHEKGCRCTYIPVTILQVYSRERL
jgi:hypothetical protein